MQRNNRGQFTRDEPAFIPYEQRDPEGSAQLKAIAAGVHKAGYTNLANRTTVPPAPDRDPEGLFTNAQKLAAEKARREETTAALRRDVGHDSWRHAGEWCLTNTAKFLLVTSGAVWAVVLAGILICVFGQVVHHFWHPVGFAVDWAAAKAGEWWEQ